MSVEVSYQLIAPYVIHIFLRSSFSFVFFPFQLVILLIFPDLETIVIMYKCIIMLPFFLYCNFHFHTHIIHQYFKGNNWKDISEEVFYKTQIFYCEFHIVPIKGSSIAENLLLQEGILL